MAVFGIAARFVLLVGEIEEEVLLVHKHAVKGPLAQVVRQAYGVQEVVVLLGHQLSLKAVSDAPLAFN